ncbi:hypothetical protein QL285_003625 [Trifolium repens]|nr:hypothetical protein QL285_003625 [Trifolium repens]
MEKNHKILDWIVNYSAILTSLMHGRTCDCFGSDTGWCFVNATKAEPGVAQSFSAAVNWKILLWGNSNVILTHPLRHI